MAGQTLLAIGNPFLFNMPQKLSASWFPSDSQTAPMMIGFSMFILGCAISFLLPILVINTVAPSFE